MSFPIIDTMTMSKDKQENFLNESCNTYPGYLT
jgi:hypothetical protein